jgi:phosphatidate phosphatase LPIN
MRDLVDHFFPPVERVKGVVEEFTDFNYWRDPAPDLADFTDSEDEGDDEDDVGSEHGDMVDSYLDDEGAIYSSDEEVDEHYHAQEIQYSSDDEDYDENDDMLDSFHSLPPMSPLDERRPFSATPLSKEVLNDEEDDAQEQIIDPEEEEKIKKAQAENEVQWERKPAMKNDLDRTTFESIKDFAEHELNGVKEQMTEDLNRLKRWSSSVSHKDGNEAA